MLTPTEQAAAANARIELVDALRELQTDRRLAEHDCDHKALSYLPTIEEWIDEQRRRAEADLTASGVPGVVIERMRP